MTERWTKIGLVGCGIVLAMVGVARADVAPPSLEDTQCQRGAVARLPEIPAGATDPRGRPLQAWPYCAVTTCESDADCDGGRRCSTDEIAFCVEDQQVSGGVTVRTPRSRGCEPDGTCLNIHATCERARRCVDAGDTAPAEAPAAADPATAPTEASAGEGDAPAEAPAAAPVEEPASSGCACHAGPRGASPIAALLAPLALLWRRRRRG